MYGRSSQALWYDDEKHVIYCFGGDNPGGFDGPDPADIVQAFTPDEKGGGEWTEALGPVGEKPFPPDIHGTSSGMFANDDNDAYFVGGFINSGTSPSASQQFDNTGLLRLNFESLTLTNSTSLGKAPPGGVLLDVPIYGSNGVLLALGGGSIEQPTGFNSIDVFDKKEQRWFSQIAEGDIPRPRARFCAVGIHGKNNASFEM